MVKIGTKIEEFEFEAYHNDEIKKMKFSDFEGKWLVLLFYPADFTFVCPTELAEAADLYEAFRKAGAEILSVSTDTAFVHKAWHVAVLSSTRMAFLKRWKFTTTASVATLKRFFASWRRRYSSAGMKAKFARRVGGQGEKLSVPDWI
jgi:peroxiredoxin